MVEDDDRLYCALKDTLHDAGCETFGLFTVVSETLNAVPESHIDVALIDVSRHDLRCVAFVRQLHRRGVPVLLIAPRRSEDLPSPLRSCTRLAKPFTEQDLLDGIAEVLRCEDVEVLR